MKKDYALLQAEEVVIIHEISAVKGTCVETFGCIRTPFILSY